MKEGTLLSGPAILRKAMSLVREAVAPDEEPFRITVPLCYQSMVVTASMDYFSMAILEPAIDQALIERVPDTDAPLPHGAGADMYTHAYENGISGAFVQQYEIRTDEIQTVITMRVYPRRAAEAR